VAAAANLGLGDQAVFENFPGDEVALGQDMVVAIALAEIESSGDAAQPVVDGPRRDRRDGNRQLRA
jgi:hypothetical protein